MQLFKQILQLPPAISMAPRKVQKKPEQTKEEQKDLSNDSGLDSGSEEQTASDESGESEESESISGSATESESESEQSSSSLSQSKSTEKNQSKSSEIKEDEESSEDKTIFIKGISYSATEEQLQELFSKSGKIVEIRIPRARETGKGKGFAYIEFETKEACKNSLALSGTECDGRRLVVDMAKSGPRGGNTGGVVEGGEREYQSRHNNDAITVFLGNVPFEFDKDEFMEFLKGYANVKDLRVPTDRDTGRPKGFAFASFDSHAEADKLISTELIFQDRTIRAQISEQRRSNNNGPRRDGGFARGGRDNGNFNKRSWSSENTDNKKHVKFE
ncbi:hypothetical protein NEHOM01_1085 [Nematocida homosporus]|uniref:uncharacterized protein n=1 Tax=Nematocida homosporus TaxID=1912981 RepID=UPI00221E802E|nr:uncharacterized protein NEHOM01_1085 [Nematocida homosporus]KAI5185808.1 hypothetical protein NEHOM01_1085 [Nematocida homosporus]